MKILFIKGNREVKVDDDHFEILARFNYNWYKDPSGYVVCWIPKMKNFLRLHNWVVDYVGELDVDHINRDKMDCRRENLRIVEHHVNLHNQKVRTDNTNGFKGIFLNRSGNWGWQTWIKGQKFTKQGFRTKEEAYQAKVKFLNENGIFVTEGKQSGITEPIISDYV